MCPLSPYFEKGKLIQKSFLKAVEILVRAEPQELAKAAESTSDPELKKCHGKKTRQEGQFPGGFGALDHVVEYCASALGWDNRCAVYEKYRFFIEQKRAEMDRAVKRRCCRVNKGSSASKCKSGSAILSWRR